MICAIFESVCNRQSSKALELAAAYLQVKKGTKEANNTIKTKTNSQGKKWKWDGDITLKISFRNFKKIIISGYNYIVNFSWKIRIMTDI